MSEQRRNIAIVAHVDHGKTTLVDCLLQQSGTFDERKPTTVRVMDSNDLEKERGITILSKNTAIQWGEYKINIVDTPGHADFGGEVERVLSMVDSVVLLVDAVDGPMPQTRFVTQKAFAQGLKPIVVVNKIDRPGARPDWVVDQTFELFDKLGATDEQLDFPIVYTSAIGGYATLDAEKIDINGNMDPLFETIRDHVAPPAVSADGPFQMQISSLDYSSYVGAIGVGRISRGRIKTNTPIVVLDPEGNKRNARITQVLGFLGLERIETSVAEAGDIVAITGVENIRISETLCDPETPEAMPALSVDEPTISMSFHINSSPFAGREGKYVTSRQIRDRLDKELIHNVALRVADTPDPNVFLVSGRGELHLSILIETMRREGYELAIGRPQVITKEVDGEIQEPWEQLTLDVEDDSQGAVMEKIGERGGNLQNMVPDGNGRVRLEYDIPARGLIGFRTEFMTATSGTGLLYHSFDRYAPSKLGNLAQRQRGVLISNGSGKSAGYALFALQERGRLFIGHGEDLYEGQVIGIHSRNNDLTVNPIKGKQLTNVRASGTDDNIVLTPPIRLDLEQSLEFIDDDELVEVTPESIRIRKKRLLENERKRSGRTKNAS
ncbi:MAG: translational GTPase TypA [Gammaproteobacteria bacterium]|nr:translational GTPase TypA [Gammaproteobacteria bacterium]PCH63876.1 MAG: translational GTPase TypA [Gammaproteobacteria bacterium]